MSTNIIDASRFLPMANYHPVGDVVRLNDGTELYRSGQSVASQGVIVIPDYYGWHSGRVQNICDYFGSMNFLAVLPKFGLVGQAGDAKSYSESSGLMDWYKSRTFDGHLKPIIRSVVQFMRSQGVEKICLLGFSWGGWVAVNLLASSDCCSDFSCAALAHPSLELEENIFGGSLSELMNRVNRPILILSDNEDPNHYSAHLKLLKSKMSSCDIKDYSHAGKAFLLHGNSDHPNVRDACSNALNEISSFFQLNLSMVGQAREFAASVGVTIQEKAQQVHDNIEQGLRDTREQFGQGLKETGQRIQEGAHNTGNRIGEEFKVAGTNIQEQNRTQEMR